MENTTILVSPDKSLEDDLSPGAIFRDSDDGSLFILARLSPTEHAAISLTDGNRWSGIKRSVSEAVEGLTLVCRAAELTVKPTKP